MPLCVTRAGERKNIMKTELIKGQCPDCGFAFKGEVELVAGIFPNINCPKCGEPVENFDNAEIVDELNKNEKVEIVYEDVVFK